MNKIISITLVICLLFLLVFLPLTDDSDEEFENSIYIKSNKRYEIKPSNVIVDDSGNISGSNNSNSNISNNTNVSDIDAPNFNADMSNDVKIANQQIYAVAMKYAKLGRSKYPNLPNISAINVIAMSRQEMSPEPSELLMWQGSNGQWRNYPPQDILTLTAREIGTGGTTYQGPLQLSATYGLKTAISYDELGITHGHGKTDRSNIADSINRTIGALYSEFANIPDDALDMTKSLNDYGIQALLALAHNNGGNVITAHIDNKRVANSFPVSKLAILQFCQLVSSPIVINKINSYVSSNDITYIDWKSAIDIEIVQIVRDNWTGDVQFRDFKQLGYMRKGQQYYESGCSMSHRTAYPINTIIYNVYIRQLLQGR